MGILCFPSFSRQANWDGVKEEECGIHGDTLFSPAFPASWDGFKDEECGIHGYTWSVGTTVCGTDVVSFVDPHSTIHNPDDWTYTGLAKDLHLADGAYYVTVQVSSSCCCCLYPSPPRPHPPYHQQPDN